MDHVDNRWSNAGHKKLATSEKYHYISVLMPSLFPQKNTIDSRKTVDFSEWRLTIYRSTFFIIIKNRNLPSQSYTTEYPQTPLNTHGILVFQYFLSGMGEEPLFRGLVIVILLGRLTTTKLLVKHQYIVVICLSTLIFMYAHLSVDLLSMSITGFDFGQQTKALQIGALLAIVFIHTRSLFAPIVLHGLSNGITATIGFYVL